MNKIFTICEDCLVKTRGCPYKENMDLVAAKLKGIQCEIPMYAIMELKCLYEIPLEEAHRSIISDDGLIPTKYLSSLFYRGTEDFTPPIKE